MWIRQRPLQRMVFRSEHLRKSFASSRKHLKPARINRRHRLLIRKKMQRGPLLCPRFRQRQSSRIKLERRKRPSSIRNNRLRLPMQSPRNHQVKHQPHFILESQCNPLPNPPHLGNFVPLHGIDRRHCRPQEKWTRNAHTLQNVADHTLLQRFDVHNNVGKLRHLRIPSINLVR